MSRGDAADLAAALAALLGPTAVRTGASLTALDPGWHADNLRAGVMALPATTREVSRLLTWCQARHIGVVPQGGRTGLVGGAVSHAGEVILSTARLAQPLAIDAASGVAVVGAGVTLQALQEAAGEHDLDPGIDTPSRGSATIGGLISTNAGGIRAFRTGVMRQRVLGLEAVLADGTVIDDLSGVQKNVTGWDAKQLLIGSEGTLGVVTQAAIRLEPRLEPQATALIGLPGMAQALIVVDHFRRQTAFPLLAAEVMSGGYAVGSALANGLDPQALGLGAPLHLILELGGAAAASARTALEEGLAELSDRAGLLDGIVAENERQRAAIWLVREASDAIGRSYGLELWYDVSVPAGALAAYTAQVNEGIAALGLECHFIGHLADGNLHVMVARREAPAEPPHDAIEDVLYGGLAAVGGAFSAEHGIGLEKRGALARFGDPGKLSLLRRLKQALDPHAILNPGKVL